MKELTDINSMWLNSSSVYNELVAFGVRHSCTVRDQDGKIRESAEFKKYTYGDVEKMITSLGAGLCAIGLREHESVAIISENSLEWFIADMAIMGNRALDVPRGISSTDDELIYILTHADVKVAFVQDAEQLERIKKIRDKIPKLESIVVLSKEFSHSSEEKSIYSLDQLIAEGKNSEDEDVFRKRRKSTEGEDIATLIYTSGTTGQPKGIPLTHANLMNNIKSVPSLADFNSSDRFLSILPIWHIFERELEYIELSVGASIWYSSKLTLLKDFQKVKPTYMASVPRIWLSVYNGVMSNLRNKGKEELFKKFYTHSIKVIKARRYKKHRQYLLIGSEPEKCKASLMDYLNHKIADILIYSKIREKVGGAFKAGFSGGGSLPDYIDDFFEVIGIALLEGYGLTETAPILALRSMAHRIPYTVGQPLGETKIKILDSSGNEITDSSKGDIWVSGSQVMQGYYKNDEETEKIIRVDENGCRWLNTGDIGRWAQTGDISIIGRSKSTIVLLGGENIEPEPIEGQLLSSDLFEQVMVCGQDQEYLTLLIVPNLDKLKNECFKNGITYTKTAVKHLLQNSKLKNIFDNEIKTLISEENGFKEIEFIHNCCFTAPFAHEDDTLTQTFKVKRNKVAARDISLIRDMYPHYNEGRTE